MAFTDEPGKISNLNSSGMVRGWARHLTNRKTCIISPVSDALLIYASPLWALIILLSLSHTGLWYTIEAFNYEHGVLSFVCGVLSTSHLLAVVFRSHANPTVFRRWPVRFTIVPVVLFLALSASLWLLIAASVVAVFWDVYHSGMQNFGIGRIYDMKMGNDAQKGRLLDSMMNLVLYAGPIAAGATLAFHLDGFHSFSEVGAAALTTVPSAVLGKAQLIRWIVIPVSLLACLVYVVGYWHLARNGYRISPQKVILMTTSALASVISWGFNPFATAFAVMNVFHAIQYYGILYAREGNGLLSRLPVRKLPVQLKTVLITLILLVPTLTFGIWEMLATPAWDRFYALLLTVTLMHFWYDGFIWSVRKKEV